MKKRWQLVTSALLIAAMTGGCTGGTESTGDASASSAGPEVSAEESEGTESAQAAGSGEGITLELWSGFTSTDGDIMADIFNKFNEENEWGITIEMDIMSWDTIDEKLPAAIAAGEAPDFVTCPPSRYKNYGQAGVFRDLSEFWELYPDVAANIPDNIKNLFTWNGTRIGVPIQVQSYYYYWDKDLFAAAGLDPESPPQTFEEVVEYAKLLTDPSQNQYGFILPTNNMVPGTMTLLAYGGDFTNEDESQATFNNENAFRAFSALNDIWQSGCTPQDVDDNTYISGQCGQFINSSWVINGLRENGINFGITTVPAAEGQEQDAYYSMCGFAIPTTTTDEAVIDAIYKVLAHWNSVEVSQRWYLEAGSPCYNTAAIEALPEEEKELIEVLAAPNEYGHVELTKTGQSLVQSDVLFPAMEEMFLEGADVQETLDKYNEVLQEMIDNRGY